MSTEPATLHIRRAKATDAVNIFKLVVDEEKRAKAPSKLDDATRIVDILAAIEKGYVSVATSSGRIVGSIGALVSESPALVGAFFALSPSYHDTPVGPQLVDGLMKAGNRAGLTVQFVLPSDSPAAYREPLVERGFEATKVMWESEFSGPPEQEEPAQDAEQDEADQPTPAG